MKTLKLLLAASLALSAGPGAAQLQLQLPDLGDPVNQTLTPAQEREIGRRMMSQVRRHLPLLEDAELNQYIRELGLRLTARGDVPLLDYRFFIVDAPQINAFAMPGGFIGVHHGLIVNAQSESELASVLAHEIAHVTQRHIARQIAASERFSLQSTALMLAAVLLASQSSQAASAAIATGMATGIQQQLNYSRIHEQEADRIGISLLASAGLDPHGMPIFFDRLLKASRYRGQPPEFLSTHPITESRVADTLARAERLADGKAQESSSFALMRNKLLVMKAERPDKAVTYFRAELERAAPEGRDAARYGLARALLADGDHDQARSLLLELIGREEHPAYLLALAQTEQAAGRLQPALERYRDALALFPDATGIRYHYAEALLQARQPAEALQLLRQRNPQEPALQWLHARAAGETGNTAESQLSMAEYYYLRDELDLALNQLDQAARNPAATPHQSARANARRDEIQRELDALERD